MNMLLTCSASCFNVLVAHNIPVFYRRASDEGTKCRSWESDQRQFVSLDGGYYRIANLGHRHGPGRRGRRHGERLDHGLVGFEQQYNNEYIIITAV